jgi:hypothetical protein
MLTKHERLASTAGWVVALLASLLSVAPVSAQEVSRPAWITVERVEQGLRLYHTKGARAAGWGSPSRTGESQPMRGPTVLDSAEVSAVAAYV